jgi:hypothetical protein
LGQPIFDFDYSKVFPEPIPAKGQVFVNTIVTAFDASQKGDQSSQLS